ncbi:PP2C family protein-serine/threonine phosphatase [Amycolatopsis anabasis]|uniref:PP2C family protein-serine/threonine phosphatase n=1 Tax=Amycolatopsis anabasis TaxID=1840409 RepID=UPI00131E8D42|nr:GAF domain-containing SpoIIE family protein phosphatase [Amycolatopsis anabasis]
MTTAAGAPFDPEERLRRVAAITDTGLAHLDVRELLSELLDRIQELLAVDEATVLLLDNASQMLVATATKGLEDEIRQGVRVPVGRGFAGRVAAEKRPIILDRVDRTTVFNSLLWEHGLRTLLGVPLLVGGTVIGVLHVGALEPRRFTEEEVKLLQLAGDRVALAAQASLAHADRVAARTLQRSLLPARLPEVPGLEFDARYVPGEEGSVAGDWYDVFTLPSGRVGVVIGDVVGHGFPAAVVMGRLRSALRAYALESDDPAKVLGKLDRKVRHFEHEMMATVLYGVLEPSLDRLHVSSAGHLAPVVCAPGRPAGFAEMPIDAPVGVRAKRRRRSTALELAEGTVVCLYTDGLVERRTAPLDTGLARLCDVAAADTPNVVCSTLMTALIGHESPEDDVALLVLRRVPIE